MVPKGMNAARTVAPGKTAAAAAEQPTRQEQTSAAVSSGELRKVLGQAFQKQPLELQDLASCGLERDGNKIVLKASSAFQQERLLKDENRRKLQDALRQRYPAMELEIACVQGTPEQSGPRIRGGNASQAPGAHHKADASDLLEREAAPDTSRTAASPGPGDEQALDNGQQADLGLKNEAEQKTVTKRLSEKRQFDEGQVDPVVGVALTLFNGKIIDETEAG
jgi:hypothetical protein